MSTLHIAGLGPGSAALLTGETAALLGSGIPIILRTRRHPTVAEIDPEGRLASCDDLYASGTSFEETYAAIAARVIELAGRGDLVYAVPGHPLVAEATVTRLLASHAPGIETRVYPALSYVDLAAVALGRDLGAVQLCDALALRIDAQQPALISQVFDRDSASALKLQLLAWYPAEHEVTVLRALGTGAADCRTVALADLDRQASSYLDCVFVPALAETEDVRRLDGIAAIVRRLHAPGGCPWDREQTHETLRPHLLEESYEVLEAIDSGDPARIAEELGDLLLQVLMHAEVGEREETFGLGDVTEGISRKLIRRHPHVFGEAVAGTAAEVHQNWDRIKQAEKPRSSVLAGVPATLPALAAAQTIQGRARRTGFDWPDMAGPIEKLREEIEEFALAEGGAEREEEFGDLVFVVAGIAQRLGIDAEQALRRANAKFRARFGRLEEMAAERKLTLASMPIEALTALWDEAKKVEAGRL
ncbi:MAG: nucleoside triphosphate pyrophosphohydrolase [Dehalococcoidia bacterium]